MIYLNLDDVLHVAERTLGRVDLRDVGLLESAVTRPQASAFGEAAYPSIHAKAAALLQSIVRNHALVDGNKRLGLAVIIAFYGVNGIRLSLTNDDAYALVMAVATGALAEVDDIASVLAGRGSTSGACAAPR